MASALISTQELRKRSSEPQLRIIDLRGAVLPPTEPPPHYVHHREAYRQAHIPGAQFLSWHDELNEATTTRLRPPREFETMMGGLGIANDSVVVAYDDTGGLFAARLWWNLRYYGHEEVYVLNGGWSKWLAEGGPTTDEIPQFARTTFKVNPQPAWRRSADAVLSALGGDTVLLDTRSPLEFSGEAARRGRTGHIPGALNLPRAELIAEDGTLKSREEIRQLLAERGIQPEDEVITYCNSGVSASYGLLALHEAGYLNAANYDLSWNEWGSDLSKPVATGK
ncbi:MAG: sulfurtransferase [Anaerolineaceae bacterium]|nr:sulfurtransferase [Anaerolineaceae bacterium]